LDKKTRIRQINTNGITPQQNETSFDDDEKTLFEVAMNDEPSGGGSSFYGGLNYTDPLVEVIVEPLTPPIHSQVMNGGNGGGGLSPEDIAVRKDWEGDCMASDWEHCSRLESISRMRVHNKTAKGVVVWIDWQMDCRNTHVDTNITCLDNGWTVNRCQLICMAKCNKCMQIIILGFFREIILKKIFFLVLLQPNVYSKKVKHAGPCVYI
jgi:hypothetical protein